MWHIARRMSITPKPRSRFGEQLRGELGRQGLSIRQLSRRIDPSKPEHARRALARWIAGTTPTAASRRAVAEALGVDPAFFDDDEDEEAATALRAITALFGDLVGRIVDVKLAQRDGASA